MNSRLERYFVHILCTLGLLCSAVTVQGQDDSQANLNPNPSTASIVGFAVVLSFLIIALCIVILLCVCYGRCRLPCKSTARAPHDSAEAGTAHISRRNSNKRRMIPQPSPKDTRPSSLNNHNSIRPERQRDSSLPPTSNSFSSTASLKSPRTTRPKLTATQNRQLVEAVSTLPTSTSRHKVLQLSQLNAESFKKLTSNEGTPPPEQRRGSLSTKRTNRPNHQRKDSDQVVVKSPGHTAQLQVRQDIPEIGLPYQPQKSPHTPREHSVHQSVNCSSRSHSTDTPIPYLSNAPIQVESSIPDTGDDISSSANEPRHNPVPRLVLNGNQIQQNKTIESAQVDSSPPPYSTVV